MQATQRNATYVTLTDLLDLLDYDLDEQDYILDAFTDVTWGDAQRTLIDPSVALKNILDGIVGIPRFATVEEREEEQDRVKEVFWTFMGPAEFVDMEQTT